MAKNKYLIIYFDRDKLYFHSPGLDDLRIFSLKKYTQDLTVTDQKEFEAELKAFIKESKFKKLPLLVIFSEKVYFSKEIDSGLKSEEQQEEIDEFVSLLPFDLVYHHKLTYPDSTKVVAINRGLYEPMLRLLKSLEFPLEIVTTEEVLARCFEYDDFGVELAQRLQESVDGLKEYNFAAETSSHKSGSNKPKQSDFEKFEMDSDDDKQSKKRLIFLGLVFVGLILILTGLILWTRQRNQQISPTKKSQQQAEQELNSQKLEQKKPTAKPTRSTAAESVETATSSTQAAEDLDLEQVRIEVLNGSGVVGRAGQVREELEALGFSQIEVGNTSKISGSKSLVMFGEDVGEEVEELIISALNQIESDFTTRSSTELGNEVVITLYQ